MEGYKVIIKEAYKQYIKIIYINGLFELGLGQTLYTAEVPAQNTAQLIARNTVALCSCCGLITATVFITGILQNNKNNGNVNKVFMLANKKLFFRFIWK